MKAICRILLACVLLITQASQGADREYTSPDKCFVVTVQYNDDGPLYAISDTQSGQVIRIPLTTKLLHLSWSQDSRNFVTVEHLAGGSFARLFHCEKDQWKFHDLQPPGIGPYRIEVVDWVFSAKALQLKYQFHNAQIDPAFGTCTFDVNLLSGKISHLKKMPLDEAPQPNEKASSRSNHPQ